MKKQYICPDLILTELEYDNIMGNFFSDPDVQKVVDDPTVVVKPPLSLDDDEEEEEDVVVTAKSVRDSWRKVWD